METLKLLFVTSRPISWVNTAYPFAAGYLLLGGGFDTLFVVGTLFFLIPYNLMMYGINDVFDYESDIANPRKGGVEGAITPKKFHSTILWSSVLLSVPFIAYLVFMGNMISNLTLSVVVFFVIAYSLKGLRFKEIAVLDSVTSSMHFVGPLLYAISLLGATAEAWVIVGAFFMWGMASHAFGAVQDVIPDREGKIHSIATILGARRTVWFSFVLYIFATLAVLSLQTGIAIISAMTVLFYAGNVAPFLQITDKTSMQASKGWKRFLWINYLAGAIITMSVVYSLVR